MKQKKSKLLVSLFAVMLCMAAFSMTAFASGDDWCEYGDYGTPDVTETAVPEQATSTPTPTSAPIPATTPVASADSTPSETPTAVKNDDPSGDGEIGHSNTLTPTGNLTLVDDVRQVSGETAESKDSELEEKRFITVQSKNGNYFYLIIDRSGDKENVHFLNQVDESDLLALMEDGTAEKSVPVCTCTDKCMVGDINTACPVCQTTMSECTGKEPEPTGEPDADTTPDKESKSGNSGLLLVVPVLAAAGGAVYYFKFRKPKSDTKGSIDLDDYDFGDEDDEDYEYEQDDDEPEERNEGD